MIKIQIISHYVLLTSSHWFLNASVSFWQKHPSNLGTFSSSLWRSSTVLISWSISSCFSLSSVWTASCWKMQNAWQLITTRGSDAAHTAEKDRMLLHFTQQKSSTNVKGTNSFKSPFSLLSIVVVVRQVVSDTQSIFHNSVEGRFQVCVLVKQIYHNVTLLLTAWAKKGKETIMLSDVSPDDYHNTKCNNSYLVNKWNSSLSHNIPYPVVIRVFTISQAVFTSATSLRASGASSLSLWASWLPFSSSHRRECCRDWSSSSSWTKNCSLEEMNGKYNVD